MGKTGEYAQSLGRLKTRRDFLAVARRGGKVAMPGLVLQAGPTRAGDPKARRVGFTVTRKVGNAVVRNRVRRRLREAARLVMPGCAARGRDYVLIGRKATLRRPFADLQADLRTALSRMDRDQT